jgi:hypothetical protein
MPTCRWCLLLLFRNLQILLNDLDVSLQVVIVLLHLAHLVLVLSTFLAPTLEHF